MVLDAIGREISKDQVIFYNGNVYRVIKIKDEILEVKKPSGKCVSIGSIGYVYLNYLTGYQLQRPKKVKSLECCLIDPQAATLFLLKK